MANICSALACNLDTHLLQAALPLLASEKVQALEWSFDTLFKRDTLPDWFAELLRAFSQEGRLVGHGVFFSLFAGRWAPEQQAWLDQLKALSTAYAFGHITEHFGFMTGQDFHQGAPLSVPFTSATLALGQDRLQRIQEAGGCAVGLENLAFAYSVEEVKRHGDFLHQLLVPINGFLILDLHNLYCQVENFGVPFTDLLPLYPLDRVREIHLSGGSWSRSLINPDQKIRRDTHDDCVPAEVFDLLERTIDQCPNLKYVVLEQLGSGLRTESSQQVYHQDFFTMERLVQKKNRARTTTLEDLFLPPLPSVTKAAPLEDEELYQQQRALATILETATDYSEAHARLSASVLAHSAWGIEQWAPPMVETALAIAQKWKYGFD